VTGDVPLPLPVRPAAREPAQDDLPDQSIVVELLPCDVGRAAQNIEDAGSAQSRATAPTYARRAAAFRTQTGLCPYSNRSLLTSGNSAGKRCYGASGEDNGTIVAPANQRSAPCHS
jgi:hypothetical protein